MVLNWTNTLYLPMQMPYYQFELWLLHAVVFVYLFFAALIYFDEQRFSCNVNVEYSKHKEWVLLIEQNSFVCVS